MTFKVSESISLLKKAKNLGKHMIFLLLYTWFSKKVNDSASLHRLIKAISYFELMFYPVYFYFVSFLKQSEIVARFIGFLSGIAKREVVHDKTK